MSLVIRLLGGDDVGVFEQIADGVFDAPIQRRWAERFVADPRHHMFLAIDDGLVVGMISAVDYVHPDKAPQLWINEVGVAAAYRRRGIGRRLLDAMLAHGRDLGCTEAWLGTEAGNVAARGLYGAAGSVGEPFVLYSFALAAADDDA